MLFICRGTAAGQGFLAWEAIWGFQFDSSQTLLCQWTQRGCRRSAVPQREGQEAEVSLLWSSFMRLASSISKEEYFILHLPSLEMMSISHLSPPPTQGKTAPPLPISTASLKSTKSTVRRFALTYLGFSPRKSSFLQGQGENLSHHDIQNTQPSFYSTQGSSTASITGIYKHEESLNRKLQT